MKTAMLTVLQATGVFIPFRLAHRRRALVLMYHRFSPDEEGPNLSARVFRQQLAYLSAHYDVVPLSFLARRLASGRAIPPRTAVITIDDGYRDAYTVAFPALREYGLPATAFVVSGFCDRAVWLWTDKLRYLARQADLDALRVPVHGSASPRIDRHLTRAGLVARINDDLKQLEERARDDAIGEMAARLGVSVPKSPPAEYAALSWDEAREMDRAGLEIGSHTATHPILTGLGSDRVRRELTESRERIAAELGRPVDLFCYPNGAFNDDVRREVRQAGYRCAVASDHGFNSRRSDPLALRRVSTEGDLPRFVQSTCGFEQMKVRVLYGAAALVRDAWRALMPEGA